MMSSAKWLAAAVIAAFAALASAFGVGWYAASTTAARDAAEAMARAQAAIVRNAELASRKEAERLALEAERDALAQSLEDQAYADADTSGGLRGDRVVRLRGR